MPRRGMGVEIWLLSRVSRTVWVMPRRGMGVEILCMDCCFQIAAGHAPQGHGSRNGLAARPRGVKSVMPCEGHGSRNTMFLSPFCR